MIEKMTTFLFAVSSAILVLGLIICQLRMFDKKHPNAEMLARIYQMITSRA
jgi:hypothetical protein